LPPRSSTRTACFRSTCPVGAAASGLPIRTIMFFRPISRSSMHSWRGAAPRRWPGSERRWAASSASSLRRNRRPRSRGSPSTTSAPTCPPVASRAVTGVGPTTEPAALERIRGYSGLDPTFATYDEIAKYVRTVSAPFGSLGDEQWQQLTDSNVRQRADGRWGLAYDPGIAVPFRAAAAPPNLWALWDAIHCPTLVLHGRDSDLLSSRTAAEMARRGPKPTVIDFAGVGHAPTLLSRDQIDPVVEFLRG